MPDDDLAQLKSDTEAMPVDGVAVLTRKDLIHIITRLEEAETALREIAGGLGDTMPLPDIMSMNAETFRHEMWTWSQKRARAALAEEPADAG